eukprot:XP_025013326.1 uncharacterized protein LOC8277787 isoform X1 [Ricinus communis]
MMYDTLLSRSFSKHEQKKLKYGGFITCFLVVFSFCTIFKPYLSPLPVLNLRLSIEPGQKLLILNDTDSSQQIIRESETTTKNMEMASDTSSSNQVATNAENTRKNDEASSSQQIIVKGAQNSMNSKLKVNNANKPQHLASVGMAKENKVEPAVCNLMERSDFCELKGDIRIDANSSTIFIVSSGNDNLAATNTSWSIRPYARKGDAAAMRHTREWSVKQVSNHRKIPECTQNHNALGIIFSLGGYSGNHFHAFTDIIVPLFSTARPFNGDVQFLVTDRQPWWIAKFRILLKALSRYEVIDIDKREEIHCFTSITIGLKRQSNKELNIDQSKFRYSMKDFRQFLRSSYSLRKTTAIKFMKGTGREKNRRPRLLIISRKRSRAFTNVGEIAKMAKGLGYKVVVDEPDADVSRSAQVMNSCDVVLGVHGAGLTNMVFLPDNAILIQVVPFGGAEWVSKIFFEEPSKDMNIRYLEYKISIEESSLVHQYPSDHVVLRDPSVIQNQGWEAFKSIYFDKQNVKIDLNRFRPTLSKALELLQQ